MKLSILFYPNKSKVNKRTGKIPVYMRLVLNRQKGELRLNVEVTDTELQKRDESTMRFADRSMTANIALNKIESSFQDFHYNNATSLADYNVKTIRDKIVELHSKPIPLIKSYIDNYYNAVVAPNGQMSEGTKRNYRKTITHIKSFLSNRKLNYATLKEVNISLAYDFRDYLLGSDAAAEKVGMKEASALDNVKKLRTIFDRAVEEGLMPLNPFKKIKLKSTPTATSEHAANDERVFL